MRLYQLAFKLLRLSSSLSYKSLMRIGRFVGRRIMQLDAKHSRIAAINIDLCFPLLSPQQQRDLIQSHYENLGMGIMEMSLSWWTDEKKFNRNVSIKGLAHFDNAIKQGNGVILVTAEFTTPDILARALGQLTKVTTVYKPHHHAFIDSCISAYRQRNLHKVLPYEDISVIAQALKLNQAVLLTHDANAGHKQISFEKFFNIPTSTNTAVSRFARMTGAPVVPVHVIRKPDDTGYQVVFETALPAFPSSDSAADSLRLNQMIERWIEVSPEQYDWSYPRFRERPEGEPAIY